ncbi:MULTISPECIES: TatD family hydrolase [Leuconostoc]|jgi:TatD DNase family protein|uniref:Mg-dependent DNase n=2 Tax=Leuconostoc citreum TaxID=33964 RepID=B1N081_LEUCK|nr:MULTISPECIES: TatD family hydrolase [Leuconostoc]ACA83183.1 Mg-dependent DNase [Leuconostoc citreum KM20]MBA5938218.1 TatD family hydrolase [Leuconostoc citreum]MBE4725003.1 TatD family hydrolase [Leuconostoc citreum]MBU7450748.1 TatD family hydrolase [Leuconostoc citreum]MCJ2167054.1 TatD family hydrolase [Leuconostoc citreum]
MAIYDLTKTPADSYDTHTHLNDDKLYHDVPAYIGRANEFRVMEMNIVGYDATGNERALEIAQAHDNIYAVLGFQPEDTADFDEAAALLLSHQLEQEKVVGVGETGLDYYWDTPSREIQKKAFQTHLALAKKYDLPVIIHNRDAFNDVYDIVKASGVTKGVMHSFSGTPEQALAFVDLGMHISFSGVVTFKKAEEVRDAARAVPLDRILVETDAPYLAPTPFRGKDNEPALVKYVIDSLAETLAVTPKALSEITRTNAHRLFLNHE